MSETREALFGHIRIGFEESDCPVFADALDDYLADHNHERAELIRAHTAADYAHVLAAYGSAYANGWKFGRDRAADLVEEGE